MDRHLTPDMIYVLLLHVRQGNLTREMGAGWAREHWARAASRQTCYWPREAAACVQDGLAFAASLDARQADGGWQVTDEALGLWIARCEQALDSVARVVTRYEAGRVVRIRA